MNRDQALIELRTARTMLERARVHCEAGELTAAIGYLNDVEGAARRAREHLDAAGAGAGAREPGSRSSGHWPAVVETRALGARHDPRAESDDEAPTTKYSLPALALALSLVAALSVAGCAAETNSGSSLTNTPAEWTLTERTGGTCGPLDGWTGDATKLCTVVARVAEMPEASRSTATADSVQCCSVNTPPRDGEADCVDAVIGTLTLSELIDGSLSGTLEIIDPWDHGCQSVYDVTGIPVTN